MERMSALDAYFLHMEEEENPMHIGGVAVFEGPMPPFDDILAMVRSRLPLVPRYRQVPRFVPLDLGRPVWQDDPHFHLEYHVRHTALPAPGGDLQLRRLAGRVFTQRLDRTKPLWELWVVEGLAGDRWSIVSKVHHAMVDGISATDLMTVVFDRGADGGVGGGDGREDDWAPAPAPSAVRLAAEGLVDRVRSPLESLREQVVRPRTFLERALGTARGTLAYLPLVRPMDSSLNGSIGSHRAYDWAEVSLDDVKLVRKQAGGTINDVVLALCTRGFRELLVSRGEVVEGRAVRTLVPVSVRRADERGTYNNRVSGIIAQLPVGVADPVERLHLISAQMQGLKESRQAMTGEALTSLGGFAPPLLLSMGSRLANRIPQRNLQTVTTNVPGPQHPLYVQGRRMLTSYPYVCLAAQLRTGVAVFSYLGELTFGVTGDLDSSPDVGVLARGIEQGVPELLEAVGA